MTYRFGLIFILFVSFTISLKAEETIDSNSGICETITENKLSQKVVVDRPKPVWFDTKFILAEAQILNYREDGSTLSPADPSYLSESELSNALLHLVVSELEDDFDIEFGSEHEKPTTSIASRYWLAIRVVATMRPTECGGESDGQFLSVAGSAYRVGFYGAGYPFRPEATQLCLAKGSTSAQIKSLMSQLLSVNVYPGLKEALCLDKAKGEN